MQKWLKCLLQLLMRCGEICAWKQEKQLTCVKKSYVTLSSSARLPTAPPSRDSSCVKVVRTEGCQHVLDSMLHTPNTLAHNLHTLHSSLIHTPLGSLHAHARTSPACLSSNSLVHVWVCLLIKARCFTCQLAVVQFYSIPFACVRCTGSVCDQGILRCFTHANAPFGSPTAFWR